MVNVFLKDIVLVNRLEMSDELLENVVLGLSGMQ